MSIKDSRGHDVPGEQEPPDYRDTNRLSNSINDVIRVANITARAQLVADVVAAGHVWPRPLYVHRDDGGPSGALERTIDGTTWTSLDRRVVMRDANGDAPPAGATPVIQAFVTEANVGANGVLTVPFLEGGFAKPPIVQAKTVRGASFDPVVDSNGVTAANVRLVWPNMPANSTVRVHVMAIGWAP